MDTSEMSATGRVVLKPRRARPFFARHPWVFDTSIERVEGDPPPGDEVAVVTADGAPIARGLYNPASSIRVRLYRWDDGPLNRDFWYQRIASALRLRHDVLHLDGAGSACRLIFSEGDGLSGLTVDRYDRWLVGQFSSLALFERRELLMQVLVELTQSDGMTARTERGVAEKEGLRPGEEFNAGSIPQEPVEIVENHIRYRVDLCGGQK